MRLLRSARRRAFTLLEVLLALGLIAMLSGGMFAFFWQLTSQKAALVEGALEGQAADALIERLENDLAGAVAADSAGGAGIVGTASSLKVLSRGVTLPLKEEDRAWAKGDLQGSEFVLEGGALKAKRWDAHRGVGGAAGETIPGAIGALRFRYYDGESWVESFDSKSAGTLPVAIEVSVWFGPSREVGAGSESESAARPERAAEAGDEETRGAAPVPRARPAPSSTSVASGSVPAADRVRVIVVPDGPTTAWKELR